MKRQSYHINTSIYDPESAMDHSIAQDSDAADEEEEGFNGLVSVRSLSVVDDWEDFDYNERMQAHYSSKTPPNTHTTSTTTTTTTTTSSANDDDDYYDDDDIHIPTNNTNTTNNATVIKTEYGAEVESEIWDRLYDYQKDGCKWLYRLYRDGVGGILVRIYYASIIISCVYILIIVCTHLDVFIYSDL